MQLLELRPFSWSLSWDLGTLANPFPCGRTSSLLKSNHEQPSLATHRDTVLTEKQPRYCGRPVRYGVIILAPLWTGLGSIPYGVWTHERANGVWILYRIYCRCAFLWWQRLRVGYASHQKILLGHKLQHLMVTILLWVTNTPAIASNQGNAKSG